MSSSMISESVKIILLVWSAGINSWETFEIDQVTFIFASLFSVSQ